MEARIDKWLWAARIFKTRSLAADACKNGRVTFNGSTIKPSRMIKEGDTVHVKKSPITYSFKVLKAIEQRVGAKLIPEIYENVTDHPPRRSEEHLMRLLNQLYLVSTTTSTSLIKSCKASMQTPQKHFKSKPKVCISLANSFE